MPTKIANTLVGARYTAGLVEVDAAGSNHQLAVGTGTGDPSTAETALVTELDRVDGEVTRDASQLNLLRLYAEMSGFGTSTVIRELGWFTGANEMLQRLSVDGISVTPTSVLKVTLARRQAPQVVG